MEKRGKRFKAVLEPLADGMGWTVVRVPFVPSDAWPEMVRLRVKGSVNGFAFRTSLFAEATQRSRRTLRSAKGLGTICW